MEIGRGPGSCPGFSNLARDSRTSRIPEFQNLVSMHTREGIRCQTGFLGCLVALLCGVNKGGGGRSRCDISTSDATNRYLPS